MIPSLSGLSLSGSFHGAAMAPDEEIMQGDNSIVKSNLQLNIGIHF
jgi:hypothetical protein